MDWLPLPDRPAAPPPAFADAASAAAWLGARPLAQPTETLLALRQQVLSIDGAALPPEVAFDLLAQLRSAAVAPFEASEARYLRKALPLAADDQRAFEAAHGFWQAQGTACLRLAAQLPPAARHLPLNRAASALRLAQFAHFEAAQECPPLLDHLLLHVLDQANSADALRASFPDPDFPHLGEANTLGHLAWAFLLRLIDPYHLSTTQLVVAHRAFSRWRELAGFQGGPDNDPKGRTLDLGQALDVTLPEALPRWFDIRGIIRKLRQRLDALKAGDSPETLKLGRELSNDGCQALLRDLDASLHANRSRPSTEVGDLELVFGADHAYTLLTGEPLNRTRLDERSGVLAHQRMALFGFDRVSMLPTAVKKLNIPSEAWAWIDGRAVRPGERPGERRQAPCLVAALRGKAPQLGILQALYRTGDGALSADIRWLAAGTVEADSIARPGANDPNAPRLPVFVVDDGNTLGLIAPVAAGLRLHQPVLVRGSHDFSLIPLGIVERGVDFIRFTVRPAS